MKCNYKAYVQQGHGSLNHEDRRAMHRRLMPTIKRIVALEKQMQAGTDTDAASTEMSQIIESLTMVEMMAVEDYICKHNLIDNK